MTDPTDTVPTGDQDRIPTTAAHPATCVDDPTEPHLDPGGDCACLGDCCNTAAERCICPECKGGCGGH